MKKLMTLFALGLFVAAAFTILEINKVEAAPINTPYDRTLQGVPVQCPGERAVHSRFIEVGESIRVFRDEDNPSWEYEEQYIENQRMACEAYDVSTVQFTDPVTNLYASIEAMRRCTESPRTLSHSCESSACLPQSTQPQCNVISRPQTEFVYTRDVPTAGRIVTECYVRWVAEARGEYIQSCDLPQKEH